jgi:hypothetical protein
MLGTAMPLCGGTKLPAEIMIVAAVLKRVDHGMKRQSASGRRTDSTF